MKRLLYVFIQVILYVCAIVGVFYVKKCALKPTYEIIGVATVQQEQSEFFVEIKGERYTCSKVYTGQSSRSGAGQFASKCKIVVDPTEGEKVTCFRHNGYSVESFIYGVYSEQKLADFFTEDSKEECSLMLSLIIACLLVSVLEPIMQKVRYLKQRQP